MMAFSKSDIIKSKPIGGGLNNFYNLYDTTPIDIPELSNMHIGDECTRCEVLSNIHRPQKSSA